MSYTIVNRIRVHYEVAGEGAPVLLLSDLSWPAVVWALQVKGLASHFRVITLDNRGVGETDRPGDAVYTMAQMADDAAAVLRELGVTRAHVVGASMGGAIAQELALRHPTLVRSLALACSWVNADARFLYTIEAWMALAYRLPIEERFRSLMYPFLFSPEFFGKKANLEAAFQRAMAYQHQTKAEGIERQARGILAWTGTRAKALAALRMPALVLAGKHDILTPPDFSRTLAGLIRGARLALLPGAHGFYLEYPDEFNRALIRFLKAVRSK